MKIEKIGENKIKITISFSDLEERNLDLDTMNYNSPQAQELFWDLMEQAEVEYGFDTSDSQILIEAMPASSEGFVIIVSKSYEESEFESINKYIKNRFKKSDLRVKKRTKKITSTVLIYSFDSFESLCDLSKRISHIYLGTSSLHKYKQTYYLVLTRSNIPGYDMKMLDALISEYGYKVSNILLYEGIISEHGELIIEADALNVVSKYF